MSGSRSRGTAMSMKNSGRLRRSRSTGLTSSLLRMVPVAPVELMMISTLTSWSTSSSREAASPLKRRASLTARSRVRLTTTTLATPWPTRCSGRQFRHLAGPDQHDRLVVQLAENLAGQFDRRITDGHGAGADPGLGAHPLGHGKGLVQQSVQDQPADFMLGGVAVGLLELAQDLRLAHDHRIEAGGDQEQVPDGLLVLVLDIDSTCPVPLPANSPSERSQRGCIRSASSAPGRCTAIPPGCRWRTQALGDRQLRSGRKFAPASA